MFLNVGTGGIEPPLQTPHARVLPLYYVPKRLQIKASIFFDKIKGTPLCGSLPLSGMFFRRGNCRLFESLWDKGLFR